MELNEDIIADLCDEIEELIEPSAERDRLWCEAIVPLLFGGFDYFEEELDADERELLSDLKACYAHDLLGEAPFGAVRQRIDDYKRRLEQRDFFNLLHRGLLAEMAMLAHFPLTQEDWDNAPLWLPISSWLQNGIRQEWVYRNLKQVVMHCQSRTVGAADRNPKYKRPEERLLDHVGSPLKSLRVDAEMLETDVAFIKKHGIESLTLTSLAGGYTLNNLDFLTELPFVKELHMGACHTVTDYRGLESLAELEVLVMDMVKTAKVDLSGLSKLRFLSFEYSPRITGLEQLTDLRQLWVWKGTPELFQAELFARYRNLKELQINLSKPDTLEFLQGCELETLEFHYNHHSFSLKGLESQRQLRTLRFWSCRRVTDVEVLSALTSLRFLALTDSFRLPSCRIVAGLTQLEGLTLNGTSYFEDNDLIPIENLLKGLKYNYVTQRKGYNIKVK